MKVGIFLTVIFVVRSISGQNSQVDQLITDLTKNLSKAFNDLKLLLNAESLSSKIKTTPRSVTDDVAINLLSSSKSSTEALVSQTSAVVDRIQAKVTSNFVQFSKTPPIQYNIDCNETNYMFYFRSKALTNGTLNINNCTLQTLTLTNDTFLWNIKTNRLSSTVHVPTNVYDSAREIQNVANYTQNLDQSFAAAVDSSQIKWQFFCSNTGFFRIFPGIKWRIQIQDMVNNATNVDFFDCRSQQWFLTSTSYPKKMMIMVDASGSMKGIRRLMANQTIYEILDTITENDYFNIILFSNDYVFCDNKTSNILIQATDINKRFMTDQLTNVFTTDGMSDYANALRGSFQVLQNEWNKENGSSQYNYVLMVISDGSPSNFQDLIVTLNQNISARIFTYIMGQGCTDRDMVKQMACNNKGFSAEISTMSDVKEKIQRYLNVVARPNSLTQNAFAIWTGVNYEQMRPSQDRAASTVSIVSSTQMGLSTTQSYASNISQTVTTRAITTTQSPTIPSTKIVVPTINPLRFYVTVSKAVYDATNYSAQQSLGVLLGAAGVDVPTTDLIKTAPFWKIGVNAYLFGVTHNGFVIFHPRFRPQYQRRTKYFYRNVDIGEVEVSVDQNITVMYANQTIQSSLRDAITAIQSADSPRAVEKRTTYDIVDKYKTAFKNERKYFITGIKGTPYKFGLAIPTNQIVPEYLELANYSSMDLAAFSDSLMINASICNTTAVGANQSGVSLKKSDFCNLNQQLADLMIRGPLCVLREVILNPVLRTACLSTSTNASNSLSDQYIRSVYNEAVDTKYLLTEWRSKITVALSLGVQQIFSMHYFGLIRYYNYVNLTYEQFIPDHNSGLQDPLYQETVLHAQNSRNPGILVVRPLSNDVVQTVSDKTVLIFTVTTPIVNNTEYKGVVGVQVDQKFYSQLLLVPSCTSGKCLGCANSAILDCYVLTRSGLVVLSSISAGHTGTFLADIDCKLMQILVSNNVFQSQELYDFQGLCTKLPPTTSSSFANSILDPFTQFFKISHWIFYELTLLMHRFWLTGFVWIQSRQEDNPAYPVSSVNDGRPCFNKLKSHNVPYDSTPGTTFSKSGTVTCFICTKNWNATSLENTNLILLVIQKPNAACSCDCNGTFASTMEISRNVSNPIENPVVQKPSYVSQFVASTKMENSTQCTDGAFQLTQSYGFVTIISGSLLILIIS